VPHTISEICIINSERARISLKNFGGKNCREFHYLYTPEEIETALARLVKLGVARDLGGGVYSGVDFNASLDLQDRICGFCGRRIDPPYSSLPKREGSLRHKACAEQEDRERVGVETVEHLRGLLHDGGESMFQAAHRAGFTDRGKELHDDSQGIIEEALWSAER
jgi:hypothetical protein